VFGSAKTGVIDADSKAGLFFSHAFGDQGCDLLDEGEGDRGGTAPASIRSNVFVGVSEC
jgi:hypothetical protein